MSHQPFYRAPHRLISHHDSRRRFLFKNSLVSFQPHQPPNSMEDASFEPAFYTVWRKVRTVFDNRTYISSLKEHSLSGTADVIPNLLHKLTFNEQMEGGFFFVVAKVTSACQSPPSFLQIFRREDVLWASMVRNPLQISS
ncbi:unnamed protein product [Linum trigynum]|uniref:Uncharacterized protein n=1 Tax=Linum trigynum TaxID=586398 RepID=A0AAV2FG12_9ROSI